MVNDVLKLSGKGPVTGLCGDKVAVPSLLEKRRPCRVGSKARRRDFLLVISGQVDGEELRATGAGRLAEEHDDAAVRSPGRTFVVEAGRQQALAGTIRLHHADGETATGLLGEGDEIAARRPDRRGIGAVAERDAALVGTIRIHHIDLRLAATVAFKGDLPAVRRVGRRSIDRTRRGQTRGRARAQVHRVDIGVAFLLKAHDHTLAIRREARREGHAGEVADQLALTRLQLQQINARLLIGEGHVGHFLPVRREARRQHEVAAVGQHAHIGTVLIHDAELRLAGRLRAAFSNEDDAGIEVALLAGDLLIDRISNDMGDTAPVIGLGIKLLADHLAVAERIPQAEFGAKTAAFLRHAAGDQRLRVDRCPIREARRRIRIADLLDEGLLVDRCEQAGTLEVGGDHARDLRAEAVIRQKIGDRDRHGLNIALVDVELDHGIGRSGEGCRQACQHQQETNEGVSDHMCQAFQH
ncbi:hypothetical protein RHSP_25736 [Rhizobium freirei PRF 81]|uniref:Uncharacterized protein n=1 Tax=Rhizobium freirei PRF 81 TaxID=363754 RepID=N6U3U1_9HYPH|nr:hypothetical protein RHSP_25736 [Rhizobium freirei PRF 81]